MSRPAFLATDAISRPFCRHCGQPLQWIESETGEVVALNRCPQPPWKLGAFVLRGGRALRIAAKHRAEGETSFHLHTRTCFRARQEERAAKQAAIARRQLSLF